MRSNLTESPIKIDASPVLIVITCSLHPWWSACRFHLDEAQDAACAHEERDHPMDDTHRHLRGQRERDRRVAEASRS